MYKSAEDFKNSPNKAVTVIGMSGVGKTTLAGKLESYNWFHYSTDYRIGTKYLNEAILDDLREKIKDIPLLAEYFASGTIDFQNKIRIDNIKPIAKFLALPGNAENGGVSQDEFQRRQDLYRNAEIEAGFDMMQFIRYGKNRYGKPHFLHDTAGSLCELDRPDIIKTFSNLSLILYIQTTKEDEEELFARSMKTPKPFLFHPVFFIENLDLYMEEKAIKHIEQIDPDDFYNWIFPKLFYSRIPKYEKIAEDYGYTITTAELKQVSGEDDFVDLICKAIERKRN